MSPGVVVGALVAVALLSGGGSTTTPGRNESGSPLDPRAYAAGKRAMLLRRYDDASISAALARWLPVLWPGTPRSAIIGASASSTGPLEGRDGYPVVGWLSVPRRVRDRIASSSAAVRAFGRAIPTGDSWYTDLEAQTFVALTHLRETLSSVNRQLSRATLRGEVGGVWALRLALAGYSVGPGAIAPLVNAFAGDLERAQEGARWAVLGERVSQACEGATAVGGVPCAGIWHAAHGLLRIDQRIASGLEVARAREPGDVGWFGQLLSPAVVTALSAIVSR